MEIHPRLYSTIIDPLLESTRKRILNQLEEGNKIIDIACGTGALVRSVSEKGINITGVDNDPSMINFANNKLLKKGYDQITYYNADARELTMFKDNSFDKAIMSLAYHQFKPEDTEAILSEVFRVSRVLILLDYSFPLPAGLKKRIVYLVERLAGYEHFKNFNSFMEMGGIIPALESHNLYCTKQERSGSGIFSLYVIEKNSQQY